MPASWVRALSAENPNVELCDYFENYEKAAENALLPPGVYTLEDLREFGKKRGWCPYFLANVIVYSYQYLLVPKVAGIISKELQKESAVVFDEAHNIDNVCIEALSVSVRRVTLEGANRNLNKIREEIDRASNQVKRYSRHDKRSKLPGWILSHLRDAHLNLSTDMAIHIARESSPICLWVPSPPLIQWKTPV